MRLFRLFLLFCGLPLAIHLFLPPAALSKLYTWTDRNGVVRRTYYPPPANQVRQDEAGDETLTKEAVQDNEVELYVTSWCPYCKKAKHYFQSRGIAFTAYDIEKDSEAAARKKELDGEKGVPFAVINGVSIRGYSPEQYDSALH